MAGHWNQIAQGRPPNEKEGRPLLPRIVYFCECWCRLGMAISILAVILSEPACSFPPRGCPGRDGGPLEDDVGGGRVVGSSLVMMLAGRVLLFLDMEGSSCDTNAVAFPGKSPVYSRHGVQGSGELVL